MNTISNQLTYTITQILKKKKHLQNLNYKTINYEIIYLWYYKIKRL